MKNSLATARLLVVSRDSEVLRGVWSAAEANLWQLDIASNAWDAMEKLRTDLEVDVLIIDLPRGDKEGLQSLSWLRRLRPALPILLMDRSHDTDRKLRSIQVDSADYLVAPLAAPLLQAAIQRSLISARDLCETDLARHDFHPFENGCLFIGANPKMHRVRAQVSMLAESDLPVFISGEPGSGKETIAQLLHQLSSRSGSAFAKVDCAALSGEMLEREIFGCESLCATTAEGAARGKLELNRGGTLLLDEIEELPLQLQSGLAIVMESRRLIRSGSSAACEIDLRVVVTSSLSFDRAIAEQRVIPELSRQFGAREIRVPPLRERKEEIPSLARHFMHQLSRQFGLASREFSIATEEAWQLHPWPGNLRELKQAVKRYLIMGETAPLAQDAAPGRTSDVAQTKQLEPPSTSLPVSQARQPVIDIEANKSLRSMVRGVREDAERAAIASALEKTGWNRKAAARLLKVSYRSILYKIEQYQINSPEHITSLAHGRMSSGRAEGSNGDQKSTLSVVLPRLGHGTS
jgi:two-component system, NtrC family, response regulator AtoC